MKIKIKTKWVRLKTKTKIKTKWVRSLFSAQKDDLTPPQKDDLTPPQKDDRTLLHTAVIGLGSNLNDPLKQLEIAISTIAKLSTTFLSLQSRFYSSKPLGPVVDQPDFVNAVIVIQTALTPIELLHALQTIELKQGRTREQRWGPRTLDCDILLYDMETIATKELTIPHPEMLKRDFVLVPLLEICPQQKMPNGTLLQTFEYKKFLVIAQ